jgi:conjugative relaxase-like TrwC/TraI family protein
MGRYAARVGVCAVVVSMRVMSAGRGFEYLLKSVAAGDGDRNLGTPLTRYYTAEGTPPGTWLGSGLSGLGSDEVGRIAAGDVVTEEQLSRLLGEGVDPLTGEQLGLRYGRYATRRQRVASPTAALSEPVGGVQRDESVAADRFEEPQSASRQPVAGFDFTFSPPKSVSVLWAVSDAGTQSLIVQAHHAAMLDVLDFMEREVAATRVGKGGVARVGVRGLIATGFDHYDSRAGDPQLHTHLVIANKAQGADGKWRTLDSRALHRATVALSETYNAYLADHTARLLGVSWVPVDRGRDRNTGWEIAVVPAPLLDEFSRRTRGDATGREGIEAVTARLTEDYRATHGRSPSARAMIRLRQQATLTTRPVKELHSLAELTGDWRARASDVLGQDATTWAQTLLTVSPGDVLLHAGDLTGQQADDLATVVLMEVGNKRAVWGRWNLHAEAARQTMGVRFVSTDDRERALAAVVQRAEAGSLRLTPAYDRNVPDRFVLDDGFPAFQPRDTIAYTSKAILDAETRLLALSHNMDGPRLSTRAAHRHTVGPDERGVTLAEDQAAAIRRLAASGRVLDMLVGPAGAGKTTALRALHTAWTATHGEGSVIGLAPSAAAADVLSGELGIRTENTAKFDYDHAHGRWSLAGGQLVLLDEASLAGTLALDRITAHAAQAGAKVVLIGDWAQLSAIETGGAFGMLVADRGDAPELTDVRRFRAGWEKTATLRLRHGDTSVLDAYVQHQRIHDGDTDTMLDAAYTAWQHDKSAGLSTVMIAATGQTVAELNQRARNDLIAAGTVKPVGVPLHDGTTAGVGDEVVTRDNDRHLTTSDGRWVKNGDRWQVTGRFDDGSLAVRRLRRNGAPYGQAIVLPAGYVREQVELGYATTVHRAQGSTVDTAHAILDPQTATRELLYVALTRGRTANHVYVPTDQPAGVEHHHDEHGQVWDGRGVLEQVMARSSAQPTATETLRLTVAEHASLTQLVSEYETIAAYAQHDRLEALLEDSGITDNQLDRILDSDALSRVEAACRRGEANGYDVERLVRRIAPTLNGHEQPAAALAVLLDRKAGQPRGGSHPVTPRRVAGLIPILQGQIPEDLRAALTEREHLISRTARTLAVNALKAAEPWTARLGPAPAEVAQREAWLRAVTTIGLYRERHHISGPLPLGNRDAITDSTQAHDYRTAQAAYQYTRRLSGIEQPTRATERSTPARGYGPTL